MGTVGYRPYYRAEGETNVAQMIAGELSLSAVGRSKEGSAGSRHCFTVDLPANLHRPWRAGRRWEGLAALEDAHDGRTAKRGTVRAMSVPLAHASW